MFSHKKFIDLTHTLNPKVPTWKGTCGFSPEIKADYEESGLRAQSLRMHAGVGTHMDAPSHFIKGGASIADIPLDELIVPLVTLDLSHKAHADYHITVEDVRTFEKDYGAIPQSSFIACHTGWGERFLKSEAYRNVGADGHMHFPTYSAEAADYLLAKGIVGIGIDTLSPDSDPALSHTPFPVHHLILGDGKYIIENMANLGGLPPISYMINLPLKMEGLTESPVRVVAVV